MKINQIINEEVKQRLDPKCWKGKHKEGTKIKGGVRVNNCVPNESIEQDVAKGLNEFAPGSGGGESGRWYTDDQMTDIVGDGWWQDMDVSGANIGVPDGDVPKQYMIQQAQDWLDDQGYSVQVLNCKVNDDDMEWFIEGNFHNPGFAKKGVAEARNGDTNFGSTVGHGSWVVYDGSKVKRFKSREGAKAYAEKNGGKVASSEFYADKIQKQGVDEAEGQQLSVNQLAMISDEALDNAYGYGRSSPGNTFGWQANLMSAAYAKKMIDAGVTDIEKISDAIHKGWNVTAQKFVQNPDQFDDTEKLRQAGKLDAKLAQRAKLMKIGYFELDNDEQEKDRVVARVLLQAIKGEQGVAEGETWSKHNNPRAGGMSKKSVSSYRRSHPGSKIQTAVTTKPSKLKKGSKAAKRRKSFCARMKGMKKSRTSAKTARDPNSNINKSLRRWNCESIEQMQELVMIAEQFIAKHKK